MNWAALLASIATGAVVGWLTAKLIDWRERRKFQALADHAEVTGPARDEAGLRLLRTDPEEFFRRTRRRLP